MASVRDRSSSASGELQKLQSTNEIVDELRNEIATLRAELAEAKRVKQVAKSDADWAEPMARGIHYADGQSPASSMSAGRMLAQVAGQSKARMKAGLIPNSDVFSYLPKPSADKAQLEADFIRWGYCIVEDAMTPEQVKAQVDRLVEQAAAEKSQDSAINTSRGDTAQLVNNLILKGQIFRDAVEFKESAAQRGPLIDELLTQIMGKDFGLGCAHGSIVHQHGGLQEIHIDQGGLPMPYPQFPFGSLIIWCYTEFNLANGSTYIVPGSHRSSDGTTLFAEGVDLTAMIEGEPGLVAICAPAGSCILTDTRVLHCGGRRTATGTRYAMRCHYNRFFVRALHEQSSANQHVPPDVYELLSDRLKQMMGITNSNTNPIGELH